MSTEAHLQRHLGLGLLTFYGLGTIVGAGIYVLISEVARVSGSDMPAAFAVAGIIAALTGACYAELSTRFPQAAGAVLYIDRAFSRPALSVVAGFMLLVTGIVSAATISKGFVGYLAIYVDVSATTAIIGLCLIMGIITSMGIRESASIIAGITLLELLGLAIAIWFSSSGPALEPAAVDSSWAGPGPILIGAFLAFYAFIGFEDMVNLAEEVHDPETTLPKAILLSIGLSVLLYVVIAIVAVNHVTIDDLVASTSPLALMVGDRENVIRIIGFIGVIAISNGALTQIIMASRVIYGMAKRGLLPARFGEINHITSTPVANTWLVTVIIAVCALSLPLVTLASVTSTFMLLTFVLVNLALIRVKRTEPENPNGYFRVPLWVPYASLLVNSSLLLFQLWELLSRIG